MSVALRVRALDLLELSPKRYCDRIRRRHSHDVVVVSPTTVLTMEGYPGSGNSFAREAFLLANPWLEVASHVHSVAHVVRSLQLARPTLVLIRDPQDAVMSLVARYPDYTIASGLERYVRFHRRLWPHREAILVAPFETVTNRFGDVIEAINGRWGTTFNRYEDTTANSEQIFGTLDGAAAERLGGESRSARPVVGREATKEERAQAVQALDGGRPLAAARAWYSRYLTLVPEGLRG